jgi:dTDP-4-amino-4,6-dideoxygalactose transaminase
LIPRFRPTIFLSDLQVLFEKKSNIEDFERAFSDFVGWKYGLLFPYGHAAAYSFFVANGVAGKEVIIPAYNCRVMLSSVIGSHNRPVFNDCEENNVNMDSEKAISRINQNTGVICPTAIYGYPFDINAYKGVSDRVLVLADLAHSLLEDNVKLSRYEGIHAAIYSLGIGKQTTMLGGGLLCTNDVKIYEKVKDYRDNNFRQGTKKLVNVLFNFIAYRIFFSPMFYRMLYLLSEKTRLLDSRIGYDIGVIKILPDDFFDMPTLFQIGLGLKQLRRINLVKERRKTIINSYDKALRSRKLNRIDLLPINPHCSHYPIFTDDQDELSASLISRGIHAVNIFKYPIYELPVAKDFKDREGYPHADKITRRCLLLPLYDLMTEEEQNHIIQSILTWDRTG